MGKGKHINTNKSLEEVGSDPHGWLCGGPRPQWRKELQMWWKQQENENQKWSLKMGLNPASPDETWRMRSCFLWTSKEGGFLRWNPLLVKILWWWLKWQEDLDYSVNLVDKTTEELERIDHSFERCCAVDKMLSNNVPAAEKLLVKGRGQSIQWILLLS